MVTLFQGATANSRYRSTMRGKQANPAPRRPKIGVDNNALQLNNGPGPGPIELAANHLVPHLKNALAHSSSMVAVAGLLSRLAKMEHVIASGFSIKTTPGPWPQTDQKVGLDGEFSYMHSPLVFKVASIQVAPTGSRRSRIAGGDAHDPAYCRFS